MRSKDELFRNAQREVAARRQYAITMAQTAHDAAVAKAPALAQAELEQTHCGARLMLAAARHADPAKLAEAQAALEKAAADKVAALSAAGLDANALEPQFTCPICQDTGISNGRPCRCVAALARTLRRDEINAASPLALCGFETFDLNRYPDRANPELRSTIRTHMGNVLEHAQQYATRFGPDSSSLLFMGSAGLGKTHLALAIADTVLSNGFDVIYSSAAALAAQLGREHFDRDNDDAWLTACKEADLLILDDLGTEFISPLVISMLYELINTRMLCRRPTLYTTNIVDSAVFETRYTEKLASRILGSCKTVKFYGDDLRRKK